MNSQPTLSSQQYIMVVDDEPYIVRMMEILLKKHGYRVFGYIDPVEALECFELETEKIQLVISDIRMPSMNGYELVRKIKDLNPEVKVILLSAFEIDPQAFSKVLPSIKIDRFVSKPVSTKEMIEVVKTYMPKPLKAH
jgi:response regulator RpfG family c-di-GMP phosphodiesterase